MIGTAAAKTHIGIPSEFSIALVLVWQQGDGVRNLAQLPTIRDIRKDDGEFADCYGSLQTTACSWPLPLPPTTTPKSFRSRAAL